MRESGHNLWEIQPLDAAGPRGSSRPCGVLFHSLTLVTATYAFFVFTHTRTNEFISTHCGSVFFVCVILCTYNASEVNNLSSLAFFLLFFPLTQPLVLSLSSFSTLYSWPQMRDANSSQDYNILLWLFFFISFFSLKKKEKSKQKIETSGKD